MKVVLIRGDYLDQTSYLLCFGKDCLLFDIGMNYAVLQRYLQENNLVLHGVFLTHGHFDHAWGAADAQAQGVKIYGSENGYIITQTNRNLGAFMGASMKRFISDVLLKEGDTISFPFAEVTAYYTPGHTVDGMCFSVEDVLIGGDTFCAEDGFGRADFPTGNFEDLATNLNRIVKTLPPTTKVLYGHESNAPADRFVPFTPQSTLKDAAIAYCLGV